MPASNIAREVYQAHIEHFGEPSNSWVYDDGQIGAVYPDRIEVLVWAPAPDCGITTFATIGMSDRAMPGAAHRAELHFAVRLDLTEDKTADCTRFLANLAMYPFQIGTFVDWWHTISSPGGIPLFKAASCVLLHPRFVPDGWDTIKTEEAEIRILNVVPITPAEKELKERQRIADALNAVDIFTPR